MAEERKIRILVVDDDTNMSKMVKMFLAKSDKYRVLTADSGNIGLLLTSQRWHRPDLILLDIKMQKMDGYEVLTRIRNNRATSYIRVIMMTGLVDTAARIKAEGLYCDAYLTKPFDLNLLSSTIEGVLKKRGRI